MKHLQQIPPPARVPFWRRLVGLIPGFCHYCGRWKVSIRGNSKLLGVYGRNASGRSCPDAHEARLAKYLPGVMLGGLVMEHVDNVRPDNQDLAA
jgi:hypothetical protein